VMAPTAKPGRAQARDDLHRALRRGHDGGRNCVRQRHVPQHGKCGRAGGGRVGWSQTLSAQ
jgi:hypothetical protein